MKDIVILIVDDDKNICNYLKRLLDSLGCQIEVAHTLMDGLLLMAQLKPAPRFVFLDLNFPDSRVEQTLNSIPRFHAINPDVLIIVITGSRDEKIEQMTKALGAVFRQKPDLRSQEDVWRSLEEAIRLGEARGKEPYEVTTQVISRITELRGVQNERRSNP